MYLPSVLELHRNPLVAGALQSRKAPSFACLGRRGASGSVSRVFGQGNCSC